MEKTIVIAGSETLLGRKLIELYLNEGYQVIAPVMTEQETLKPSDNKRLKIIPWNRSSMVSAKTVFREGISKFKSFDQVIIVNPELTEALILDETNTGQLDELLNSYIHGTIYLVKEFLGYLNAENSGIICFAETQKGLKSSGILSSIIRGAFHQLAEGILLSENRRCGSVAFTSSLTDMEDYAEFIKDFMESRKPEIMGQWLEYGQKKKLFQSLPIIKRK